MLAAPCPHCQRTVKIQEEFVGKRVHCPKCKQVFSVNDPNAPSDESEPIPTSASYYEIEGHDSGSSARMFVAGISIAVLVGSILVVLAVAIGKRATTNIVPEPRAEVRRVKQPPTELDPDLRPALTEHVAAVKPPPIIGRPTEGKEGETWTHRELFDYLRSHGLDIEDYAWGGLRMVCVERSADDMQKHYVRNCDSPEKLAYLFGSDRAPGVLVIKKSSAAGARDLMGASHNGVAWGRFTFQGYPPLLAKIRAALL